MYDLFVICYLLVSLALILLVLIQHGKGASMGAAFGAGASGTVFGSSGTGNFLTKTTTFLAILFFMLSLVLGNLTAKQSKPDDGSDFFQSVPVTTEQAPAKKDDVNDIPVGN
ncbi:MULTISPECIES: preprotein translocase subunit SecG [Gammaproteobacteria]|uniref:preprotein translocase subunit SecG n=1 Tax=Gammaproteobacteria TaxID=1236 RepID=UPI001E53DAC3|nr:MULTISPECIES: preprotein translocase subunit SecG [Gammaproteobacteria]MDP4945116.1 preprotein translocase subunit SecG [Alishewanella sp.]MCC5452459.1 preprotein translocase subunit SecG [Rheinheimera sp. UJ51]MDP5035312.1 preprotein translocase subunit SecG [Alishewanella sp.]MDP5186286.1 preprotein translocase subunit SecG [Alishewanella sp.]MDP5459362.1 preprotein translocase subunit SecG [Alishewanella sp. SMS8]